MPDKDRIPAAPAAVGELPRSLLGCLPLLWQRVLFPGKTTQRTPWRWHPLLLLIVLPATLFYPCLSFTLFDPDEGRYAQIPREMLARGEWVVPYLQGEPYLDKPPLFYWLVMLSYQLLGVHAWSARLVPALAIHGSILATFLIGRRSLGGPAAFWGALLLGLASAFTVMGRLLVLDGVLTFWITLGLFSLFEATREERLRSGWWVLAALACGLGVLTKGPVALILVVPPVLMYRWLANCPGRIRWVSWVVFAGIVLAVVLPWFVAVCLRRPEFAQYFLWEHNIVRFLAPFDHLEPFWFYVPVLLLGLLPGTLLLWPILRFLLSGQERTARQRTPELGFMLLAGGWCVLFFSLSGSKLPTYVLPAFPALALALGTLITVRGWNAQRWPRLMALAAFGFMILVHFHLVPWFARQRAPMGRYEQVMPLCADRDVPLLCYPRSCDSVAFYLDRDDLLCYRSKHTHLLIQKLREHPRSVVLCTHRHTLAGLRQALPSDLHIVRETNLGLSGGIMDQLKGWMGETALGLCDIAVVERQIK